MLEYKINDDEIVKYKKGLSEADYVTIISVTVDAYRDGLVGEKDDFGVVKYNPIKAQQAFYRALFDLTIENYDVEKFSLYFEEGIHNILLDTVINAQDAWDSVQNIIQDSMSVSMSLENILSGLLEVLDNKLLDGVDISKILKKFPKDLSKALEQYADVMAMPKSEFDEKFNNGGETTDKK